MELLQSCATSICKCHWKFIHYKMQVTWVKLITHSSSTGHMTLTCPARRANLSGNYPCTRRHSTVASCRHSYSEAWSEHRLLLLHVRFQCVDGSEKKMNKHISIHFIIYNSSASKLTMSQGRCLVTSIWCVLLLKKHAYQTSRTMHFYQIIFPFLIPNPIVNILRSEQNGCHLADQHFQMQNEIFYSFFSISLVFVSEGSIDNTPTLVQITAWCQTGNKL